MANKETKKEKFIRLAVSRTNNALDNIRLIGNLSNKIVYDYTDEQVEKIFAALEQAILEAKGKFAGEIPKRFSLSDESE